MELLQLEPVLTIEESGQAASNTDNHFINANTSSILMDDLRSKCIIPSFSKDNESTISHTHFIEAVYMAARSMFKHETILAPAVRVSHPVKGRIPSAMGKPAKLLKDHERTIYHERMAFIFEIPSIIDSVGDNEISMTIGGVRAYNETNLYSKKSAEKFKVFIGFKNKVCTNLCISTDGFIGELKIRSVAEIVEEAYQLFGNYNPEEDVKVYNEMTQEAITEQQFAQLVGRSRMYHFMPSKARKTIPAIPLMDSQISTVTRDYYSDKSFCRSEDGMINLWQLFNLFTGANKSSYIDSYLERGVGSQRFVKGLREAYKSGSEHWFIG